MPVTVSPNIPYCTVGNLREKRGDIDAQCPSDKACPCNQQPRQMHYLQMAIDMLTEVGVGEIKI